ncbi:MAG: DNA mismatch repair endonuclease MutL [Bacilli bacterium]|nr:DNA mismatch repair endonuclease MutL [Bacilli bacterium]
MSKIKVMDDNLANKIAAGEVVEKCVSIVKELVENSIDAKSSNIKIELIESGVKEIKVTDDGVGMDKEDAILAFSSHATSKLLHEDDLYNISSLGFRGEALPSIASISEVTLKTSMGGVGTIVNIKGGKLINNTNGDARVGTIVTVKNIFYNTPARLKHMNSLYTELANIVDFINRIALSHIKIAFSLYNDGKQIFLTDGSNNQLKVIKNIYGIDVAKKMIAINTSNDDYEISGFISYPEVTKSNRNHMITLVNGRVVKNTELNRIINEAYHTYKPVDRYPIVVLNIKVDPSLVDVNIHPTKMDIKFSKFDALKDLIEIEISNKLNSINLIPKIETKTVDKPVAKFYEEQHFDIRRVEENIVKYQEDKIIEDIILDENINDVITSTSPKVPELYPVGLVKGTYIICQNELGMYLIDQHAAKERINYEFYLKVIGNPKQDITDMLVPITIELPNNEYIILKENLIFLSQMGFMLDEMGINTIMVRSHPTWLPKGYEEEVIRKIIDLLIMKESNFNIEKFNEKIAITLSCKLSIKANENISIKEMEHLIDDLKKTNNPYTCPHGRPTIIFYSNYELEKLFKRAM